MKKTEARKFAREILENLENKREIESFIGTFLLDHYSDLHSAMVYSALPRELSLQKYIEKNKKTRFFFPRITSLTEKTMEFVFPRGWKQGEYGILEPLGEETTSPEEADMVFLPCLAVNSRGFRLGQGGGFYDRSLQSCSPSKLVAVTTSILFPLDFSEESHDCKIGAVITEKGLIFIEN